MTKALTQFLGLKGCETCGRFVLFPSKVYSHGFLGTYVEHYCRAHKPRYDEKAIAGKNKTAYFKDGVCVDKKGMAI